MKQTLKNIGITPRYKGYNYILTYVQQNVSNIWEGYWRVALMYNTTPYAVERAIRYCVQNCKKDDAYKHITGTYDYVSPSIFLACLRDLYVG